MGLSVASRPKCRTQDQPFGTERPFTEVSTSFQVTLPNYPGEETLIHWHGLTPSYQQDGFPDISAPTITAGKRYALKWNFCAMRDTVLVPPMGRVMVRRHCQLNQLRDRSGERRERARAYACTWTHVSCCQTWKAFVRARRQPPAVMKWRRGRKWP